MEPGLLRPAKEFISEAAGHDIIVEVTLFSSIYNDRHWGISPQNPENNVNIRTGISMNDAQTLQNGPLLGYQLKFVRKMVRELTVSTISFSRSRMSLGPIIRWLFTISLTKRI